VAEDDVAAARWFGLGAQQGDAMSQFNLGLMYSNGDGVAKDYVEAVNWYRRAAQQGDARTQVHFGIMYAQGTGVAQDSVHAYAWSNLVEPGGGAGRQGGFEQQRCDSQANDTHANCAGAGSR
jgi:TPR repeat protein